MQAAVITISSSRAAGSGAPDESGPLLAGLARDLGATSVEVELVPDDQAQIEARLRHCCNRGCRLVLTTGGTGLAPSDVTPEATRATIEREVPGIGEAMRAASRPHTPNWMLSRATAGVRGETLIVNFPGSPGSVTQVAEALAGPLRHALALLGDERVRH